MRNLTSAVVVVSLALTGCGEHGRKPVPAAARGTTSLPNAATADVPGEEEKPAESQPGKEAHGKEVTRGYSRMPSLYQGKTAEQWGASLAAKEWETAWRASWALRILGPEGRPHLLKALDSPNPQTRRIALESLNVAELRAYGENGRQLLVKLAGDKADSRIRERACLYLSMWQQVIPAP